MSDKSDQGQEESPDKGSKDKEYSFGDFEKQMREMVEKMGGASFSLGPGAFPGMEKSENTNQPDGEKVVDVQDSGEHPIYGFSMRPRDIKAYLDRFVIRQDEAKKALAIAVCDHYNHAKSARALAEKGNEQQLELQKQNVMVVGPTGVGKTYLVKHIAELIGVPFVKADATKFSETGYVGGDVDDLVRELVTAANGDIALAEYGIVYIDEIDKLASKGGMIGRDVSGRGVQTTLLKLMEETEVPVNNPMDMKGQMMSMMKMGQGGKPSKDSINTRHILFIVSGAFSGLEDIVERRMKQGNIGFGADFSKVAMNSELFGQVGTADFIEYGFEAEFIGRLPVRVVCESLEAEDFVSILKYSEGSLLRQYEREFAAYGIRAEFTDGAIEKIAQRAVKEETGARALMTVCERILRDFKYELPGTTVSELMVNSELIEEREKVLSKYRELSEQVDVEKARQEAEAFSREFEEKCGVQLSLDDEALVKLGELAAQQGRSILQVCGDFFGDYEYGFKLLKKSQGGGKILLPAKAVEDLDTFLSEALAESYRKN